MLTACAKTVPLATGDRDAIQSVFVAPEVNLPERMYYQGPGSQIGYLFGGIGAGIDAAANIAPAEQMTHYARENGILIEDIVKGQLTEEIRKRLSCSFTEKLPADATLKIEIPLYGMTIPANGFSNELVPVIQIKAELQGSDGKTLWKDKEYISALSTRTSSYSESDIYRDPENLRRAFEEVVTIAVGALAEGM